MNWIKTHLDEIMLLLFGWTGMTDILDCIFHDDTNLRLQVGLLWLLAGVISYVLCKGIGKI